MKKIIIAPLAAFVCSTAFAADEPKASVFGRVDLNTAYVTKNGANNNSVWGMGTNGNTSSRLGFKASQDLDSITVGIHLEGAIGADNGAGIQNFQRRSTASISNKAWGEVRFGRDLTPSYSEVSKYDVFGSNGIGKFHGWSRWEGGAGDQNGVRADNLYAYYSPSYSGFKYGIGYAADEDNAGSPNKLNRYGGLFADYGNDAFSATLAYGSRREINNLALTDRNELTFGAGFDAKVVKINALVQQTQYKEAKKSGFGDTYKVTSFALGGILPIDKDQVKVQFAAYQDNDTPKAKSTQFAVGYVNNRSDNFALYGTLAFLKGNEDGPLVTGGLAADNIKVGDPAKADDAQIGLQLGTVFKF